MIFHKKKESLVNKAKNDNEMNTINKTAIDDSIKNAEQVLSNVA